MHPEPLEISEVLEETRRIYLPRFEEAGGSIAVVPPAEKTLVMADRPAVFRILGCLLDNAIKYSDRAPEVVIRTQSRGNSTQIRVADRGPGIPREESAKIFDKFYQIDQRLERSREGCGLGLTIARKLATAQGGTLMVTSNPGGGACFVLSLPDYRTETTRSKKRTDAARKARSDTTEPGNDGKPDGNHLPLPS